MVNCSFCGKPLSMGTGVTVFNRMGAAKHYCSRKCDKNTNMGRVNRKLKWAKAGAGPAAQGKGAKAKAKA